MEEDGRPASMGVQLMDGVWGDAPTWLDAAYTHRDRQAQAEGDAERPDWPERSAGNR